MNKDIDKAIDNYIEVLEDEAYEDIQAGEKEDGEKKLEEAAQIKTLKNAIESANRHGFINGWSEEEFLEEFGD